MSTPQNLNEWARGLDEIVRNESNRRSWRGSDIGWVYPGHAVYYGEIRPEATGPAPADTQWRVLAEELGSLLRAVRFGGAPKYDEEGAEEFANDVDGALARLEAARKET